MDYTRFFLILRISRLLLLRRCNSNSSNWYQEYGLCEDSASTHWSTMVLNAFKYIEYVYLVYLKEGPDFI